MIKKYSNSAAGQQSSNRRLIATEVDTIQHSKNLAIEDLTNTEFVLAGAESIPCADQSIDVVLMFKSLHHVPLAKLTNAMAEIARVLKPGGLVYISEPVFAGEFNEILRLFHDEELVRAAAYDAIQNAMTAGVFKTWMPKTWMPGLKFHMLSYVNYETRPHHWRSL